MRVCMDNVHSLQETPSGYPTFIRVVCVIKTGARRTGDANNIVQFSRSREVHHCYVIVWEEVVWVLYE